VRYVYPGPTWTGRAEHAERRHTLLVDCGEWLSATLAVEYLLAGRSTDQLTVPEQQLTFEQASGAGVLCELCRFLGTPA
jgi:hypothetical protein